MHAENKESAPRIGVGALALLGMLIFELGFVIGWWVWGSPSVAQRIGNFQLATGWGWLLDPMGPLQLAPLLLFSIVRVSKGRSSFMWGGIALWAINVAMIATFMAMTTVSYFLFRVLSGSTMLLLTLWEGWALMLLWPPAGWSRAKCVAVSIAWAGALAGSTVVSLTYDHVDGGAHLLWGTLPFLSVATFAMGWWVVALLREKPSPQLRTPEGPLRPMSITCPRCGIPHLATHGVSSVCGCGIRIVVRLSEALCEECHYPLRGLTRDHCLECGRRFPLAPAVAPAPGISVGV